MKRLLFIAVILFAVLALFVACGGAVQFKLNFIVDGEVYATIDTAGKEAVKLPENPTKEGDTFDGWYWDKDTWQKPFTANSLLDAPLSSDMNVYAKWKSMGADEQGTVEPDLTKAEVVSAPLFAIDGKNMFVSVSNSTEAFSFIGQVTVRDGGTWQISTDIYGMNVIPSKTAPLNVGDNTFYLLVTMGNDIDLYTVNVRRRPIYTVTFDTANGTAIATQRIEENSLATAPTTIPQRTAYTFAKWNFDFSRPIMGNTVVTAEWNPVTYTITYNLNGGTNAVQNPSTYTVKSSTITFATPTRMGYIFKGWNQSSIAKGSTGDKTITAQWEAIFTISGNTITGLTTAGKRLTKIEIPNEIDDVAITIIGDCAFSGCSGLTSITIPNSVTSIGSSAFYGCTGLTSATIPDSVTSIGDYAFYNCSSLTSVTIPDSVTSIGDHAFSYCSDLTNITIPNSVTSIGNYAFYYCSGLTSITIGNSVTSIGNYAFSHCSDLTNITIPNSVTSIGSSAFYGCSNLQYNEYDNALYFGNNSNPYVVLVKAKNTSITTCAISGQAKVICNYAFHNCSRLTSITIPDSVTSIGDHAFSYCSGLTSVTIPDSVTSIGNYAFYYCSGLTSITIGNSVTSIGNYAFSHCSDLTNITIPNSVTSIGNYAFYYCSGLTSVTFENTGKWYITTTVGTSGGTYMTVTNTSTNATNLKTNYSYCQWYRK